METSKEMTNANAEVKTAVQCASASYYSLICHLVECFPTLISTD